ncbi:MAG: hypothetical protein H7222_02080 [Methylotenera sp.]|nr:hypothetical protein [Oligoflexia bacterium]
MKKNKILVLAMVPEDSWAAREILVASATRLAASWSCKLIVVAAGVESGADSFLGQVLEVMRSQAVDLIILGKPGRMDPEADSRRSWISGLMGAGDCPVLLLTQKLLEAHCPFASLLVPMSGESTLNPAVEWAINYGNSHQVPVDLLHVTGRNGSEAGDLSLLGGMSDQFHHEYPGRIEQFVARASPYSSPSQKRIIRNFIHSTGDALEEIKKQVSRRSVGLLVIEIKGHMEPGRAKTVKELLKSTDLPILLVRSRGTGLATLHVGLDFAA